MTEVQFGDLPKRPGGYVGELDGVPEQLRARPGEWALVITKDKPETASAAAVNIKQARVRAFGPVGAFEATRRGCDVWARYVGDPS